MKLTPEQINSIKHRYSIGAKKIELVKMFNVDRRTIYRCLKGHYDKRVEAAKEAKKLGRPLGSYSSAVKTINFDRSLLPEMNRLYEEGKSILEISEIYMVNTCSLEPKLFTYRASQKAKITGKSYADYITEQKLCLKQLEKGIDVYVPIKDQLSFIKSKIKCMI